jgi:hypothetical protein
MINYCIKAKFAYTCPWAVWAMFVSISMSVSMSASMCFVLQSGLWASYGYMLMSMSMLHIHVNFACLRPSFTSMSMLHVNVCGISTLHEPLNMLNKQTMWTSCMIIQTRTWTGSRTKGEALQMLSAICLFVLQLPLFFDSADRKWIYAQEKMTAQ